MDTTALENGGFLGVPEQRIVYVAEFLGRMFGGILDRGLSRYCDQPLPLRAVGGALESSIK